MAASAATPQCGQDRVEVYSMKYATPVSLGFVETVFLGIPVRGVPTIVHQASSSDPAEDLIIPLSGTVSQLYAQGMVSAAVNEHYGGEHAAQIESILGNPAHQLFTPIIMQHLTGNPGSVPASQPWGAHFGTTP